MRVALTFDDGPGEWTGPILDLLAEHGAHATFFVVGSAVAGRERLLERMVKDGHEIGNHTWQHPRVPRLTDDELFQELQRTNTAISEAVGIPTRWWRAPHFDVTERDTTIAYRLGLTHVGCDIDPSDWKEPALAIFDSVVAGLEDGAVVDLHDGLPPGGGSGRPDRASTVMAVGRLLTHVDAAFLTVSELR